MQVEWLSVPIYRVGLDSVIIIDESHGNKEKGGEGERSRVGGSRGRKDVWRRLRARGGKVSLCSLHFTLCNSKLESL